MKVLALFDGMSCGQLALQRLGIPVEAYYASEIDKHAIKVTQHNFPHTIQMGDVTKWREWDIPWHEISLLLGGSPCQGFSFAGKQLAFDDPRSALFFVFVDIWNHIRERNPQACYLLENVRMKAEHENVISTILSINPLCFNSSLVSAQNRERLYWTNIHNKPVGLFGDLQCCIPAPKDRRVYIHQILQPAEQIMPEYYLKPKSIENLNIIAQNYDDMQPMIVASRGRDIKASVMAYKRSEYGKKISREYERGAIKLKRKTIQQLEPINDGKSNTLTTVQKDNLLLVREATASGFAEISPGECFDATMPKSKTRRGRRMAEKSNCMTATKFDFIQYTPDFRIRRLTPVECERLQTVPDNYTAVASDTQRYRMLGNGWTVDMIAHILSYYGK
jgi:DNA (cytosine-5)-methyltransferase 3A